jgi:hypothetical protein
VIASFAPFGRARSAAREPPLASGARTVGDAVVPEDRFLLLGGQHVVGADGLPMDGAFFTSALS